MTLITCTAVWCVTAVAPGLDGRWATLTESHRTELEALADARRLALEARPAAGAIRFVPCPHRAMRAYVVADSVGDLAACIVVWQPRRSSAGTDGIADAAAG